VEPHKTKGVTGTRNYQNLNVTLIYNLRKKIEDLRESEEKYRLLFDNANDLIQSVDMKGNFVYVNRKWKKVLGYSDKEIKNLNLQNIIQKDHLPYCMTLFGKVICGESLTNVETVFVAKNKKEICVNGNVAPEFKNGKFNATVGIFRDITEKKKAEDALKESEEKYRTLFKSSRLKAKK